MREFLKFLLAATLGVFVALGVFTLVFFGLVASLVGGALEKKESLIGENAVLSLSFDQNIPERASDNPFARFRFGSDEVQQVVGLNQVKKAIQNASTDPNIRGIFMDLSYVATDFPSMEEIRKELQAFKKSGKFIYAYGEVYTQGSYFMASLADSIFLYPEGELIFNGFGMQATFIKGTLDKMGVDMKLIRVGKYKSAGETFIRKDFSAENREQMQAFVQSAWGHYLRKVSEARSISTDSLQLIADQLLIRDAEGARKTGLVDRLAYRDEVLQTLMKKTSASSPQKINFVSLSKYVSQLPQAAEGPRDKQIAVIYAIGEINSGEGDDETIGSDRIANAIREARLNDKVKAIVLRVNSPGGSALASDVIWREAVLAKKTKPFIVSMGNVAASGGYYIAAAADSIFAQPNTVTGSIGVFGLVPNMEGLLTGKLGLTFDGVKTGKYADLGNTTRAMSPDEEAIIQNGVNKVYATFLKRVADGRNMSVSRVDSLAQGRIYSGIQAKKIGLVDELGGLDRAIQSAAKKAGLKEYRLTELPKMKDPFDNILNEIAGGGAEAKIKAELGEFYTPIMLLKKIHTTDRIQTRMDVDITLR